MNNLKIQNFGPIDEVNINFGDLTFFVGPQASGKSITLEALKLIEDRDSIIKTLDKYNYILGHDAKRILNVYFGEGLEKLWKNNSILEIDSNSLTLNRLTKKPSDKESSIFFVPAQRIVCMGDGYPKFFSDFTFTTPYVLREFSETLRTFVQFGLSGKNKIFPITERLKGIQKTSFDKNIFHSGEVLLSEVAGQRKMQLEIDGLSIPFMSWSAGQKEFMPLLLAFYCLSGPPSKVVKRDKYKTVIIEEPEMGLHPKAIESVLLQICELICNGYKVIVSTHSSLFTEFAWAFNTLKESSTDIHSALCDLFRVSKLSSVGIMLNNFVTKTIKTYYFYRNGISDKVSAKDISSLDVMSDEPDLSEWGGITGFSTRTNEIVSQFS